MYSILYMDNNHTVFIILFVAAAQSSPCNTNWDKLIAYVPETLKKYTWRIAAENFVPSERIWTLCKIVFLL